MARFDGRTAIVTGAGAGIGEAIALALLAEGATVVANDLSEDRLDPLAGRDRCVAVAGDTSDPGTGERLVEAAGGRPDLLFNNAGVFSAAPAEDYPIEAWRQSIDVNLSGYFYIAQAVGRAMIERRAGAIVNVASSAGLLGVPNNVAYCASKHGVVGLTKALAVEWARYGIRVNALCPGLTDSDMTRAFAVDDPERYAQRLARVPLPRAADSQEQAATALFLASSEAQYITGIAVPVDGGTGAMSSGYAPPTLA